MALARASTRAAGASRRATTRDARAATRGDARRARAAIAAYDCVEFVDDSDGREGTFFAVVDVRDDGRETVVRALRRSDSEPRVWVEDEAAPDEAVKSRAISRSERRTGDSTRTESARWTRGRSRRTSERDVVDCIDISVVHYRRRARPVKPQTMRAGEHAAQSERRRETRDLGSSKPRNARKKRWTFGKPHALSWSRYRCKLTEREATTCGSTLSAASVPMAFSATRVTL